MLSLKERIDLLEQDLTAKPPRISVYRNLPFAILRYEPNADWTLRHELRLLATRLEEVGKRVHFLSLGRLLHQAIEESEGLDAVIELERTRGYLAAQEQVTTYLSDPDFHPLPTLVADWINGLPAVDAKRDIVFLTRATAMAPAIYHMSKLLDELQGRTAITTVLCYPGGLEGTTGLRFMNLQHREAMGNYRVKIYG